MIIQRITGTTATTPTSSGGISRITTGSALPKSTIKPVQVTPQEEKKGFLKGAKKFAARTAVSFADLVTESLDFGVKYIIDNPIFNLGTKAATATTKLIAGKERAKKQEGELNKWKDIYKGAAEKPKLAIDKIQQKEYLQPSKKWTEASIQDKITKYPGETVAILGSSIIPSFILYATNPVLGLATTIGSTGNDVKMSAIENGVPKEKAEKLGLVTGILVGALDRIVPDELFNPAQKGKFVGNFVKRIVKLGLKEAGTEIAQEDLQIAAEATFREDLGWDEIKTRNVLSGLGGLLGGTGATTVVGTINNVINQDILVQEAKEVPETKTKPVETTTEPSEAKKVGKIEEKVVETPKKEVIIPETVEKEIKTVNREQVETAKTAKEVRTSLKNIINEYQNLTTEAEGKAAVAFEQRQDLDTDNISKLKRIYSLNKRFREGDIETIRNSKSGELVNTVIENIQEKFPEFSEQEAFDYAISLPTKAEEKIKKTSEMKTLNEKGKALNEYLKILSEKRDALSQRQKDILFTEWQKVIDAQENLYKLIEVPKEQLPVGEGKEKASKLEARLKGVIGKASKEEIDNLGLTTYNTMNKADQIAKASEYVVNNQQEALDVLQGKKNPPKGIIPESIYVALTELAKDDITLATKLTTLQATALGQRISILSEIDKDNPIRLLNEIYKIREAEFKKRTGKTVNQAVNDEVKNIKGQIKALSKYDFAEFLNSIEC